MSNPDPAHHDADRPADPAHDGARAEVAKPRFWGPASWWRIGLVALLIFLVILVFAR